MKITGGCSYIDFIGFEITNHNQGLYLDDDAGTSTPCTNLIVRGIHIHDVGQEGLAVRAGSATGPRNFLIENSEIDHTGRLGPSQNGEGMYIGNSSGTDVTNGVTARNNTIHDTQDECVELKGDSHDNIIESNELYNCLSPGSSFGNTGGAIEIDETRARTRIRSSAATPSTTSPSRAALPSVESERVPAQQSTTTCSTTSAARTAASCPIARTSSV
jgi:hypothetical protein